MEGWAVHLGLGLQRIHLCDANHIAHKSLQRQPKGLWSDARVRPNQPAGVMPGRSPGEAPSDPLPIIRILCPVEA